MEADLISAVVEKLNRPVHLVGHSFGGAVALQLALRHPEHLKSLTLSSRRRFISCAMVTTRTSAHYDRYPKSLRRLRARSIAVTTSERCAALSTIGQAMEPGMLCQIRSGSRSQTGSTRSRSISGRLSMIRRVLPMWRIWQCRA
ncbi:MAG: alpha/beta fold hydrolase [Pseudolabrys sp.]